MLHCDSLFVSSYSNASFHAIDHFSRLGSLKSEGPVDALHEYEYDGLPAHEPPQPVEQLPVHHVRLLPGVWEHPLQVDLLVAVWARLLLAHDAPPSNAEFVEPVCNEFTYVHVCREPKKRYLFTANSLTP